jgi:hypothetical protein
VAAVLSYHLGCYFEYRLHFKDSARVVPVHVFKFVYSLSFSDIHEPDRFIIALAEYLAYWQLRALKRGTFGMSMRTYVLANHWICHMSIL